MSISWEAYNVAQGRPADWRPNQPQQPVQPTYQPTYQQQQQPQQQQQVSYNQFGQPIYGQPQPNYNQQAWGSSSNVTPSAQHSTKTTDVANIGIDTVEGKLGFENVVGEMRNAKFTYFASSLGSNYGKITLVVPHEESPHAIGISIRNGYNNAYSPLAQYLAGSVRSQNYYAGKDSQDGKVKWVDIVFTDEWSASGGTFFDLFFYRVPSGSIYSTNPTALVGKLDRVPFSAISGRHQLKIDENLVLQPKLKTIQFDIISTPLVGALFSTGVVEYIKISEAAQGFKYPLTLPQNNHLIEFDGPLSYYGGPFPSNAGSFKNTDFYY